MLFHNAVPQRVVTNLPPPPDNNMSAGSTPCQHQNVGSDQKPQVPRWSGPKAKKGRRIQTERVEGVALTNYWPPGETVIPSDEKWKLMGPEWLDKFKKAKINDRLHSSVQTKKKILMSAESTWVLRHCKHPFDALMRKRKR